MNNSWWGQSWIWSELPVEHLCDSDAGPLCSHSRAQAACTCPFHHFIWPDFHNLFARISITSCLYPISIIHHFIWPVFHNFVARIISSDHISTIRMLGFLTQAACISIILCFIRAGFPSLYLVKLPSSFLTKIWISIATYIPFSCPDLWLMLSPFNFWKTICLRFLYIG